VGGVFGLLAGAAFLWVPSVGPLVVTGSLAEALLGGVEGAVVGAATAGLLGWRVGRGIAHESLLKYEEAVRAGKFLLVVHGIPEAATEARDILAGSPAGHLDQHAPELVTDLYQPAK
jgi:hypothetical protein